MAHTEIPRADKTDALPDLVPVRMLNEYTYCPRLAYLEWVQGEFADSADTLDGTYQHRRVNQPGGRMPEGRGDEGVKGGRGEGVTEAAAEGEVIHSRSVHLSAPGVGLVAVMDLVEAAGGGRGGKVGGPAGVAGKAASQTPRAGKPGSQSGPHVVPVDYKRGRVPDNPERSWEPERVQLCAQGLILRENGYRCDGGVLYFVDSRTRVPIDFDEPLVARTLELLRQMRQTAAGGRIPPPLVDSPKCPRCSLVGICLPDETRLLAGGLVQVGVAAGRGEEVNAKSKVQNAKVKTAEEDAEPERPRVRMLIPRGDDGRPLYVTEPRAWVGKSGDVVQVRAPADPGAAGAKGRGPGAGGGRGSRGGGQADGRVVLAEVRLAELSHVCLFGTPQISTQLVHELCDRQVPVAYFSFGGYFRGLTGGLPSKNVELRIAQYRQAADPAFCLSLARAWVAGKIENQRTMLRRNHDHPPAMALDDLKRAMGQAAKANSLESLLGVEGNAAKVYFGGLQGMLRPRPDCGAGFPACDSEESNEEQAGKPAPQGVPFRFDFTGRNRRPPTDPVNALLSLGYAVLARDLTAACWVVGLDPFLGFFHSVKYGRPALALDLMEESRAIIVDSTVLTAINTGVVTADDFVRRGPAVALRPDGRRRFLQAYERRMETLVTHPVFGYRISYRRLLEVQARILSRVLLGELPAYVPFTTR